MKKSILSLFAFGVLVTAPVSAFAQFSFSGKTPPNNTWENAGVMWKVVEDEGVPAIEFRNENPDDFIASKALLDYTFAEILSKKGFVLRNKIKILPTAGGTNFSFYLNLPSLTGIGLGFYSRADSTTGTLSISSYDAAQSKHVSGIVENAFNRYLDLEVKFVPGSTGGKFTVSVDGKELYSINSLPIDVRRYDFVIKSGKRDDTAAKASFLIQNFEVKAL